MHLQCAGVASGSSGFTGSSGEIFSERGNGGKCKRNSLEDFFNNLMKGRMVWVDVKELS